MTLNTASLISKVFAFPYFLNPTSPLPALCWYLLHPAGHPGGRRYPYDAPHLAYIYPLVGSRTQSGLLTWLMSKWDFNSVTQPSPCGHICMSTLFANLLIGNNEGQFVTRLGWQFCGSDDLSDCFPLTLIQIFLNFFFLLYTVNHFLNFIPSLNCNWV